MNNIDVIYNKENLELSISIIKTLVLFIFTYYTKLKIMNQKLDFDFKTLKNIIYIIFISITCEIVRIGTNYLISIVYAIFMMSFLFTKFNFTNEVLSTIVSIAINYIIRFISIIFCFILDIVIRHNNDWIDLTIIIFFNTILLYAFSRIKKFKYGISFVQKNRQSEYMDILILNISLIILFSIMLLSIPNITIIQNITVCVGILVAIMFITIQKSLQLYYKQKLLVQELNETKAELEKKEKEVEELEAENLSFSKKSHTLAHKQKSLEFKLQEILAKSEISKEEAGEVRDRIKEIGKDLYKEKTVTELDKTGIIEIDDMLKYMQSECNANKIEFELQLKGNIHYMTNNLIDKKDLETLLADHIKNAIIAINHTENINKSILVRLGKIDETYGLYIYDSGIEFKLETLENLGKKPSTTHANEGGTGMGFMNTFDTLRKCNASLIIEEYNEPSKDNYTKAIMIKFDGKNEFKIKSYRENNLSYPQKVI